ncbi:cytoplasmic protein [Mycena polygramma]|nr:cytoplasmic protein [Mycena polygramma]
MMCADSAKLNEIESLVHPRASSSFHSLYKFSGRSRLILCMFFFSRPTDEPADEDLIKFAYPGDVWFHVDKLSSAHVYIRLPEDGSMTWDAIPEALLTDCAQLVKANSIEGNKKDNLTIIYTPADNLKKTGDMAVGQVSFRSDKKVKRVHVAKRENVIVNRLNKTKTERVVDHEQERVDRLKREAAGRRAAALEKKKADAELARTREAEKAARSYDSLSSGNAEEDDEGNGAQKKSVRELEEDFM